MRLKMHCFFTAPPSQSHHQWWAGTGKWQPKWPEDGVPGCVFRVQSGGQDGRPKVVFFFAFFHNYWTILWWIFVERWNSCLCLLFMMTRLLSIVYNDGIRGRIKWIWKSVGQQSLWLLLHRHKDCRPYSSLHKHLDLRLIRRLPGWFWICLFQLI